MMTALTAAAPRRASHGSSSTMRAIYAAAKALGLDEETRRDLFERETGHRHLTDMSAVQQGHVLNVLKRQTSKARPAGRKRLDGPYAPKLQALWVSGWNLGIVHQRTDAALLSFVTRQTGIEHTRFLRDAADARKAVEALKKWIAREGGVVWGEHDEPIDAVIAAQGRRLGIAGLDLTDASGLEVARCIEAFAAWRLGDLGREEKIAVSQALGAAIRDLR